MLKLKKLELVGFKSFAKKTALEFTTPIVAVVGPNGSGKSNIAEAVSFVLGEQSMKSLRGRSGSDLIFKGSKNLPRLNRASVSIIFDNKNRLFSFISADGRKEINLDFDQIEISREIYNDGNGRYLLNGSEMRLKDILSLLASVNLGFSGYQIISQGEADRILNSSPRERREMIEDALGLRLYQYRLREAERKLEKTRDHMKETESIRRELLPHLKFLEKQAEKIKKADRLRADLELLYKEYLKREEIYLETNKKEVAAEMELISSQLRDLKKHLKEPAGLNPLSNEETKLADWERKIANIRMIKNELSRKLGWIEGRLETIPPDPRTVPAEKVKTLIGELSRYLKEALRKENLEEIKDFLRKIQTTLFNFSLSGSAGGQKGGDLKKDREIIMEEIEKIVGEEKKILENKEKAEVAIEERKKNELAGEKKFFELKLEEKDFNSRKEFLSVQLNELLRLERDFHEELNEAKVLMGDGILNYKNFELLLDDAAREDRAAQEERRRKLERLKIRLEDAGAAGGEDILREYRETKEREEFLAREISDLKGSLENLKGLIKELKGKIDLEFREGIKKINQEFQKFFVLMFGGGRASISVEEIPIRKIADPDELTLPEEGEESEQGIEINVSVPRKKAKGLQVLSGGERSLVSIALLFSVTRINPPPFLILDEMDAALDEANSRKYGDMLDDLSKNSQLILITHNRETMSRAGFLYGVTLGPDDSSKLLSVNLAQAAQIAK